MTIVIAVAGIFGVLLAWGLPPFATASERTEDAYVHGMVTPLSTEVSGTVKSVAVRDYERVAKGDLLIQLDTRGFAEKLAQAKAQLASSEASLSGIAQERAIATSNIEAADASVDAAQASLAAARKNLERATHLQERGVMTESDTEDLQLSQEKALAALRQAKAQAGMARQSLAALDTSESAREAAVSQARAAVSLAQIDLDNTSVFAPIDGRLGEVSAHQGQYVSAGSRLLTIVPDDVWIVANFKETQLDRLRIGQPVQVSVDALGGTEYAGHIERFSPATGSQFSVLGSSNATGNFIKIVQRVPVLISLDKGRGQEALLAPGMSVVVSAGSNG
ncbi:HlyD family secretion protein [uncultured Paracoccus sp.]|uniref:HlyD family secretion protein n=1 Tax=uncultured Paracoccus sp. TaxID=189685 RepID=UPI0026144F73|nr:HlyD family secretion protein [uncultured Paracoccus sp.]